MINGDEKKEEVSPQFYDDNIGEGLKDALKDVVCNDSTTTVYVEESQLKRGSLVALDVSVDGGPERRFVDESAIRADERSKVIDILLGAAREVEQRVEGYAINCMYRKDDEAVSFNIGRQAVIDRLESAALGIKEGK